MFNLSPSKSKRCLKELAALVANQPNKNDISFEVQKKGQLDVIVATSKSQKVSTVIPMTGAIKDGSDLKKATNIGISREILKSELEKEGIKSELLEPSTLFPQTAILTDFAEGNYLYVELADNDAFKQYDPKKFFAKSHTKPMHGADMQRLLLEFDARENHRITTRGLPSPDSLQHSGRTDFSSSTSSQVQQLGEEPAAPFRSSAARSGITEIYGGAGPGEPVAPFRSSAARSGITEIYGGAKDDKPRINKELYIAALERVGPGVAQVEEMTHPQPWRILPNTYQPAPRSVAVSDLDPYTLKRNFAEFDRIRNKDYVNYQEWKEEVPQLKEFLLNTYADSKVDFDISYTEGVQAITATRGDQRVVCSKTQQGLSMKEEARPMQQGTDWVAYDSGRLLDTFNGENLFEQYEMSKAMAPDM